LLHSEQQLSYIFFVERDGEQLSTLKKTEEDICYSRVSQSQSKKPLKIVPSWMRQNSYKQMIIPNSGLSQRKGTAENLIRATALGFVKIVLVSSIFKCIPSYLLYGRAGSAEGEGLLFLRLIVATSQQS